MLSLPCSLGLSKNSQFSHLHESLPSNMVEMQHNLRCETTSTLFNNGMNLILQLQNRKHSQSNHSMTTAPKYRWFAAFLWSVDRKFPSPAGRCLGGCLTGQRHDWSWQGQGCYCRFRRRAQQRLGACFAAGNYKLWQRSGSSNIKKLLTEYRRYSYKFSYGRRKNCFWSP